MSNMPRWRSAASTKRLSSFLFHFSLCQFSLCFVYCFSFSHSPPPEFVPFFCSLLFSLGCWGQHNCIFVYKLLHFKCNTVVVKKKRNFSVWAFSFLLLLMSVLLAVYLYIISSLLPFLLPSFLPFALFCFIFRATPTLLTGMANLSFLPLFTLQTLPLLKPTTNSAHASFCSVLPQSGCWWCCL